MAQLNNQGIRTAKANVDRWFVGDESRRFVPLSGNGIRVSAAEELAIKAGCEPYIAKSHDRFTRRLTLLIVGIVVVVTSIYLAKDRVPALDHPVVDFLAYFIYAMAGLLMVHEGWRWERSMFDLRDAVALSLAERRGQPLVSASDRSEPDYRKLSAIAFTLSGAIVLWPTFSLALAGRDGSLSAIGISDGVLGIVIGAVIGILTIVPILLILRRRAVAAAEDGPGG